jgi:hypothetical protein
MTTLQARRAVGRFVASHLICRYNGNSTPTSRFRCKLVIERLDKRRREEQGGDACMFLQQC